MNVGAPLVRKLVLAQESRSHRLALLVLYWCGLRRNELRNVQWRDIVLDGGSIIVTRRQRLAEIPLHEEVLEALRKYAADNKPRPFDYLLHWESTYRHGTWPRYWLERVEKPERQLSPSGVDKWWQRCVRNAGLEHFPMRDFVRAPGSGCPSQPSRAVARPFQSSG